MLCIFNGSERVPKEDWIEGKGYEIFTDEAEEEEEWN